ncbi:hypothetical protein GCM10027028_08400 [Streptomyces sundarbansensis]
MGEGGRPADQRGQPGDHADAHDQGDQPVRLPAGPGARGADHAEGEAHGAQEERQQQPGEARPGHPQPPVALRVAVQRAPRVEQRTDLAVPGDAQADEDDGRNQGRRADDQADDSGDAAEEVGPLLDEDEPRARQAPAGRGERRPHPQQPEPPEPHVHPHQLAQDHRPVGEHRLAVGPGPDPDGRRRRRERGTAWHARNTTDPAPGRPCAPSWRGRGA